MNWHKLNRAIHRDLGYLCVGLTLVYAISGAALNHVHQGNPNYVIEAGRLDIGPLPDPQQGVGVDPVAYVLVKVGDDSGLRSSLRPAPQTLKVFTERGTCLVQVAEGAVEREFARERPGLFPMNYLHLSHAKRAWT